MEAYATSAQIWAGALIFARIGAVLLMLPGIGESYVPPRIRLSLALVVTLVFATDTHHLFIAGLVGSYELIAPVRPLVMGDFATLAVRTVGDSFLLGVQLAGPVLVFALVFNIATGLIGRVMPQFQVFFAAAPLSVILGLSVFALSLGVLGTVFIDRYRRLAEIFVAGAGGAGG